MDPKLNCTMNAPKYYFGWFLMTFMRVLYILGNKTNNKEIVRMGMGKIQKATNKMMIYSGIYFRGSTCERQLDSRLKGRRVRFTNFHVKVMEKIIGILRPRKGNSLLILKDLKTKRKMQVS